MHAFWQQVVSGIANGGIYAALALALVVVYRVSGHINFAQGEMATFSTFMALTLLGMGLPLWLSVTATVALSFLMGMGIERLLIRPFEHKPPLMTFTVVQVISRHPDVLDCAVIGVPDDKWGEAVKAVVQLKPGAKLDEASLEAYCREHLNVIKVPKSFDFIAQLPRSPAGKVLKRVLRDPHWAGRERKI